MSIRSHNPFRRLRATYAESSAAAAEHKALLLEETTAERVTTDRALRTLAPIAAPADLQLRLRLAVSHEHVRAERRLPGRMAHQWHLLRENTFRSVAFPGAVAAVALLLLVGVVARLGAVTPGQAVEANDIPLIGFSSPHYLYSSSGLHQPIVSSDEAPVLVEALVNDRGRVYHYRVIAGTLDPTGMLALRERMLSGVFTPARILGEPVRGRVMLTFADVEVHG